MGCSLAALVSGQAVHAQSAPPEPDAADAQAADIVVTGYRESIEAARDTKRDSAAVVDAIVAEDIAQFPQANLSEAVQRISGVQIRRDFAGAVGNEISIRGLGPEYTQVTINGQGAPTTAEDRTFNFNILPADLFRKVEVFKSPTADIDEGGIGGTVSLETIRPLDLKNRLLSASIGGNYNEITDTLDPRGSLVAGGRLAPNLGLVGALSIDNFAAASQSYDAVRWTRRNFDVNGDKVNDYTNTFLMDLPRLIHEEQDVRRIAASGRLEWEPTSDLKILIDGLYTNFRQDYRRVSPIWAFNGGKGIRDIHVDDGVVDYISYDSVLLRSENHKTLNQSELYQGSAAAEYRFGDWKLKGFISKSRSNRDSEEYVYYGDITAPAAYDTRDDSNYYTITTPIDIADPTQYVTSEARHNRTRTRDDDFSGGFELKGPILADIDLKLGVKYRDRQRMRQRYAVTRTKINEPFSLIGDVLTGFLDDEPGAANGPHAFAISDFDKAYTLYGSKLDVSTGTDLTNFFDVEEKTWAGYGMATYRDGPLLANLGLRVVHTSLTSNGIEFDKVTKTNTDQSSSSDYTDFLPSLNLRYEVAKGVFLRAAAARVMTRPSLSDLAAYRVVDDATLTISAKNPDLKPFRANQFDLAAEWYFGKGGLLSAGYFYKDIESFIVSETVPVTYDGQTYRLTHPVNGNDARVQGVEVNYQQPLTFLPGPLKHLGIVANYTFTDSSFKDMVGGTTLTYGLPENSKHSFNLIGYYEDADFSVRLAYNYRSEFLREKPNEQDGLKYRSAYGQADFAARYKLMPKLTLTLDVLNLLNASTDEWVYEPRLTDGRFTTGRTVQFGLRASF
ncbi:TonB-dependent receptor [Sphingobium sp. AS12]|uniref:TonB-dependent receptor n=1 Tax=Sphingobium sp. AS12 TaxID=2849495 RepID=UPI001C31B372|nr:TonB-dependent receptor [Sphingobium sp. AS12]